MKLIMLLTTLNQKLFGVWQSSDFLYNGELNPSISVYYITVCGINNECRFEILEDNRVTEIICQT